MCLLPGASYKTIKFLTEILTLDGKTKALRLKVTAHIRGTVENMTKMLHCFLI